jgi:hypothetical protein
MTKFTALLTTSIVALAAAGAASAGSTIVKAYGGAAGAPVGNILGAKAGGTVKTTGTLPFTGLSLVGVALFALLLVGVGIALARASRRNNASV